MIKNKIVSLQSLSGGMSGDPRFLHRFIIGKDRVSLMGMKPVVSENALKGIEFIAKHPEIRAKDLMNAINDKSVSMIIANIGGFDSHKLIEHLDIDLIKKNPKPILGYSDITSLHLFFYQLGIQTFYGPTVLDGFAENVEMHDLTKQSLEQVLFSNGEQIIESSKEWTSDFLDWSNEEFDRVKRPMHKEKHGHIWVNFESEINGHLIGGCLDTLIQIKSLEIFPKIHFWKDSVMFLETSEQKMNPQAFEEAIKSLKNEINASKAVIFGKPKDETYFEEYLAIAKRLIDKPFVFNLNFGHTAPMYTIPYGGTIKLDNLSKRIIINK